MCVSPRLPSPASFSFHMLSLGDFQPARVFHADGYKIDILKCNSHTSCPQLTTTTKRLMTLSRKRNLLERYYVSQELTRRPKGLGLGHEQEGGGSREGRTPARATPQGVSWSHRRCCCHPPPPPTRPGPAGHHGLA